MTGVIGLPSGGGAGDVFGAGVGVVGATCEDKEDLAVPKRLAARIYCAKAAFCSGVAVLFATACKIALNSGLVAAISVNAFTVRLFELGVVCIGAGIGAGAGGLDAALAAFAAFSAFSAASSTLRTDRKRVSGNICGPITTGHIPSRVVMYEEVGGGSFLVRRVGFHTFGKWYPWTQSSLDCSRAVVKTPLNIS